MQVKESSSKVHSRRSVDVARMWWPHCVHTLRLAARSRWKIICWQAGHWCHRLSGTDDRVNRVRILGRTYSVSQLMREWIAGARAGSKEEKKRIGRVCHG